MERCCGKIREYCLYAMLCNTTLLYCTLLSSTLLFLKNSMLCYVLSCNNLCLPVHLSGFIDQTLDYYLDSLDQSIVIFVPSLHLIAIETERNNIHVR